MKVPDRALFVSHLLYCVLYNFKPSEICINRLFIAVQDCAPGFTANLVECTPPPPGIRLTVTSESRKAYCKHKGNAC
jgi:hypothetical protein